MAHLDRVNPREFPHPRFIRGNESIDGRNRVCRETIFRHPRAGWENIPIRTSRGGGEDTFVAKGRRERFSNNFEKENNGATGFLSNVSLGRLEYGNKCHGTSGGSQFFPSNISSKELATVPSQTDLYSLGLQRSHAIQISTLCSLACDGKILSFAPRFYVVL